MAVLESGMEKQADLTLMSWEVTPDSCKDRKQETEMVKFSTPAQRTTSDHSKQGGSKQSVQ